MTKPSYLTVAQAAVALDLAATSVRAAIKGGRLPAVRVLGRIRLDPEVVARVAAGTPAHQESRREARATPTA